MFSLRQHTPYFRHLTETQLEGADILPDEGTTSDKVQTDFWVLGLNTAPLHCSDSCIKSVNLEIIREIKDSDTK